MVSYFDLKFFVLNIFIEVLITEIDDNETSFKLNPSILAAKYII